MVDRTSDCRGIVAVAPDPLNLSVRTALCAEADFEMPLMTNDPADQIRRQEEARGRALVNADWDALSDLLTEDLVHIHANGQAESKREYLDTMRTKMQILQMERISLQIRVYRDFALATGALRQSVRIKGPDTVVELHAATTQGWIRTRGIWRQNSFQATRIT